MEVADSFIPTGGAVGTLPIITYFFFLVAAFVFAGLFLIILVNLPAASLPYTGSKPAQPLSRLTFSTLAVVAAVMAVNYYLIQAYYQDVLAQFVTITDENDRRTLIRESFNALNQYRYIALFITTPSLLFQLLSPFKLANKLFASLLVGGALFALFLFIGQQSLSFDNEVQAGLLSLWGSIALFPLGFLLIKINQLRKKSTLEHALLFQPAFLLLMGTWLVYFIGYWLTLINLDFNGLQLVLTITDVVNLVGVSVVFYQPNLHTRIPTEKPLS